MKERRYDIDWLRTLATFGIFFFHCARFFDTGGWHLKNSEQSVVMTVFLGLFDMWEMPIFFLISGMGAWYSLRSRTGGRYLYERVKRLLVPLYTVGAFLLLPPQFYFELVTNSEYAGSLWRLIPPYGDSSGSLRLRLHLPMLTNIWPAHLWFLQFLFLVSLLMLPLLLYLRSASGQRVIERLAGWSHRRGGLFLFLIPLALVRIGLRGLFQEYLSWAALAYYAIFFLIGYVFAADRRFTESYRRHGWACLVLGLLAYAAEGALMFGLGYRYPGPESYSWMYVVFNMVMSIGNFCWVMFILSLGAKHLNFSSKTLSYGGEMVLPFYILHQTVILCVGWFVIRWNTGILPKYVIIALVSFALIMTLYEGVVKRINVLRFLFGMRPKRKPPAAPDQRTEGAAA